MKYLKLFEDVKNPKMWLFPTDERFESAILSIEELKTYLTSIQRHFDNNVIEQLSTIGYNPNYIFIGKKCSNWLWYNFDSKAFNWMKENKINFKGPVGMTKEEYKNIMIQLDADKYNL